MKIKKTSHRIEGNRTVLLVNIKKPWEVAKGHSTHRGGAGIHADSRTKRLKTRMTQYLASVDY